MGKKKHLLLDELLFFHFLHFIAVVLIKISMLFNMYYEYKFLLPGFVNLNQHIDVVQFVNYVNVFSLGLIKVEKTQLKSLIY